MQHKLNGSWPSRAEVKLLPQWKLIGLQRFQARQRFSEKRSKFFEAHADSAKTKKMKKGVGLRRPSRIEPGSGEPLGQKGGDVSAARELVKRIRESGGTPLLFQTWTHRDGWPKQGLPSAEAVMYGCSMRRPSVTYRRLMLPNSCQPQGE